MANERFVYRVLWLLILLADSQAACAQMPVQSQSPYPPSPTPLSRGTVDATDPMDAATRAHQQAQQAKAVADDRHKKIAADAERLLKLANELKEEVDQTTKNELSVTVMKKAAEVEKVAHDIRTRMAN